MRKSASAAHNSNYATLSHLYIRSHSPEYIENANNTTSSPSNTLRKKPLATSPREETSAPLSSAPPASDLKRLLLIHCPPQTTHPPGPPASHPHAPIKHSPHTPLPISTHLPQLQPPQLPLDNLPHLRHTPLNRLPSLHRASSIAGPAYWVRCVGVDVMFVFASAALIAVTLAQSQRLLLRARTRSRSRRRRWWRRGRSV